MTDVSVRKPADTPPTLSPQTDTVALATDANALPDEEVLLVTPPPRPTKTVRVQFVRAGYRLPKIVAEPKD